MGTAEKIMIGYWVAFILAVALYSTIGLIYNSRQKRRRLREGRDYE